MIDDKKVDWKECCSKRLAKSISPDFNMINSLKKTSENKLKSSEELKMSQITANSKFTLMYDSLRETLEALALKTGYKIYNHECYTAFLKEILNQSIKGDEFDEIRKIRNSINYYRKDISIKDAQELIKKVKELRSFVLGLLG